MPTMLVIKIIECVNMNGISTYLNDTVKLLFVISVSFKCIFMIVQCFMDGIVVTERVELHFLGGWMRRTSRRTQLRAGATSE